MIKRIFDATPVNEVVNHPEVYPWVHGSVIGPLDLTPVVKNPHNMCLWGEHGGAVFLFHQPGSYEIHVQVVPEGRGRWALEMTQAALHWMFVHTDAVEIMTRVPKGNRGARALAQRVGFVHEFNRPAGWVMNHEPVPVSVQSLQIQRWMATAPNLIEEGKRFHVDLTEQYALMGRVDPVHPDDENHDRYVGAAVGMIKGGQPHKAVVFYNRWARVAGYREISILKDEPVIIDISESVLMVKPDGIKVVACQSH